MERFAAALRGVLGVGLVSALAACSGDLTTSTDSPTGDLTTPTDTPTGTITQPGAVSELAGSLRLRCERRSGRSKISVDGNNLSPRDGSFRARVRAAGGTVTSAARRAVADEAEFDFDSNRNDIAAGATRISATFIARRSGPDLVGEILNSQGAVVASQGVECSFR